MKSRSVSSINHDGSSGHTHGKNIDPNFRQQQKSIPSGFLDLSDKRTKKLLKGNIGEYI